MRTEICTTQDELVDLPDGSWELRGVPPAGVGWKVFDASLERRTTWIRITEDEDEA